jgi:hypothetical protein
MFTLNLTLHNPWAKDDFKHLGSKHGDFPARWGWLKNKAWEIQACRDWKSLLGIYLRLAWRGRDHAGPGIELTIFGLVLDAQIYDVRHWDYKAGTWEPIPDNPMQYPVD